MPDVTATLTGSGRQRPSSLRPVALRCTTTRSVRPAAGVALAIPTTTRRPKLLQHAAMVQVFALLAWAPADYHKLA